MRRSPVVALALIMTLAGCRRADRAAESGGAVTTEPRIDPAIAVCAVIAAPWDRHNPVEVLEREGITFTELVAQNRPNATNEEAAGTIGFARNPIFDGDDGYVGELGPYEPALAYLDARGVAWAPEFEDEVSMPKRTEAVVESAKRLDRDLAHGLCAPTRAPRHTGG